MYQPRLQADRPVLHSLQESENPPASCLPSVDLDWLAVLEYVVEYMESQPKNILAEKTYGAWIMHALYEKYPC